MRATLSTFSGNRVSSSAISRIHKSIQALDLLKKEVSIFLTPEDLFVNDDNRYCVDTYNTSDGL